MKKQPKKLVLAKETITNLRDLIAGGSFTYTCEGLGWCASAGFHAETTCIDR